MIRLLQYLKYLRADTVTAEIAALKTENYKVTTEYAETAGKLRKEISALQSRIRELEGALEWYGDITNWEKEVFSNVMVKINKGQRARQALSKEKV